MCKGYQNIGLFFGSQQPDYMRKKYICLQLYYRCTFMVHGIMEEDLVHLINTLLENQLQVTAVGSSSSQVDIGSISLSPEYHCWLSQTSANLRETEKITFNTHRKKPGYYRNLSKQPSCCVLNPLSLPHFTSPTFSAQPLIRQNEC